MSEVDAVWGADVLMRTGPQRMPGVGLMLMISLEVVEFQSYGHGPQM